MRKLFTYKQFGLMALLAVLAVSCKREDLEDVMVKQDDAKVSLTLPEKIEIAGGTNYTLDNSELVIPVTINFDGNSSKAFAVGLTVNLDTVATLVANNKLPAGTIALADGSFTLPTVVNVAYGVNAVSFNLVINRTFLEKNYGKDIAFAAKIGSTAKGNVVTTGKNATIVVLKTAAMITPEQVHLIKFAGTQTVFNYPKSPTETGWTQGSQDLVIPLNLTLSGLAGATFTVDLVKSPEVVQAAITAGTLVNTRPIEESGYNVDAPKLSFDAGKNTATTNMNIRIANVLFASGKKLAFAFTLKNPSKWQLASTNTSIIVVVDPSFYLRSPFNGTPFLIKKEIGVESDFIPASNYDFGGKGIAWFDNGGRDGGQFRRPDEVDIADNNITVGWTASGEWLSYTVNVEESGTYQMNAIIGSPDANRAYTVYSGVRDLAGTLVPNKTPGGYGDQQPNYKNVHLDAGIQVIRFYMDNANYDYRGLIFKRIN